ncbi:haloacid dehalogenase superfamily enzyme, subfamily IA [Desulfosporosinus orientis DSM 765]|uniref:Haloacid dehalogenase superfamily enzyme, subfamily IA n=1 Tax=Desulfosporosinus orientis (strain ATCC 19365 / DSM 765 / NCIMB 8382 / VKM B-1628 / Singapore I) TaxID=768706 RepID=G7WFL5_DESOD|nr:HAD family hydrolase [Desulfosporosinus orientis]AET68458.1 haloacid dehalogenase superfamily enzyme, subfamily IA [Desulfosporosinus orientis DSM 765]
MDIDSIIFDLDGTLWNSIEGICKAWKIVLANYPNITKVITPEDMQGCMGLPMNEIGIKLFPDFDEDFLRKLMKEFCETEQVYLEKHGGMLFPKLEETLKKLSKKYKLFIVSNCQDGYIQAFFKAHKLDKYFSDFESWGVTGLSKGENNKLIMVRNDLKKPIYVGDTNGDAESAKVAEIPFVYARYGFGKVEEYDYVIDSFEELITLGI